MNDDAVPLTVVEASRSLWNLDLAPVWRSREVLFALVARAVKVRYKQAAIGVGWAIVQPVLMVAVFSVVFGRYAGIPSNGLPYPVFALTGLIPWNLFAQAVGRSGTSLVASADLLRKVYFPRLNIPLAAALATLVDFIVASLVLVVLMLWQDVDLTWRVLFVPLLTMCVLACVLAVALWLAPLNVRYRDIGHALPFLIQIWMFASPVVYPMSMIPERWRFLYGLNPMATIIEGFRWAVLGQGGPSTSAIVMNVVTVSLALFGGLVFFKHMERSFADVI